MTTDEIGVCGLAEEGCKDITSTADGDISSYDHTMIIYFHPSPFWLKRELSILHIHVSITAYRSSDGDARSEYAAEGRSVPARKLTTVDGPMPTRKSPSEHGVRGRSAEERNIPARSNSDKANAGKAH